ncbi:glycosyltransferase [Synechococcales cyanobacterium C]|uniref:Glycosyltransferase n=1 Tax=Petrachloros mirabilis ULC683 TaxID=2781853 RepID=A0A8K2A762_9CYAN|nr:glycosyltransferase family 4 protein [Petrachloros mirabilis]NCJ06546.1 glycosyltransferase [Petrachloros mirabilis ULC683]
MHIAWIGKKSPPCGNVTYSREITNALLEGGYRVSFLHFAQDEPGDGAQITDLQEVSLPFLYKSQVYTIPSPRSSKVLAAALGSLKPDLVHASLTLSPLDFVLPEICEALAVPLVATFHPPFSHKHRNLTSGTQHFMYQLYAPFLANYDAVIVFSQVQKELLSRLGVPDTQLVVIPNGVDTQKYSPGISSFKHELKAQQIFVYQGRISIEKNVESLLKAWRLANLPNDCKLVIVGDGALITSLMPAYGPEHNILWMGAIADEQRRIEILRGADVFVLPSFVEGLSLSLLEAMGCGLACLATDAGADGEVLEGGAGIVLNPQRAKSEIQTLLPVLAQQPEMIDALGRKARSRVIERYSLDRNIDSLEKFYAQVATRPKVLLR